MMRHISLAIPVNERDHCQGPDTAAVTLVQFGDYECPYTRRTTWVVQPMQQELGVQALLEFFQSTYEAGILLGRWDREALERQSI